MVCVNYIRISPTSEYLDINVYTPIDFEITGLHIKADGSDYIDFSGKLIPSIPTGYSKEQILRIPMTDIGSDKHLFFVKFDTRYIPDITVRPECYKDHTVDEIAVADIKFSFYAKLRMIKRCQTNPTCAEASINDINLVVFIENMLKQSMKLRQYVRSSYWMKQLEQEVQFINDNY